jgi:hypothetical protein
MAATNFTPISLYFSTTASAVPVNTNLVNGELAINITDGKLYYKNNGGTVTLLAVAGGAITPITNNGVVYINGSGQAVSGSALTFDGTTVKSPILFASSTDAGGSVLQVDTTSTAYGRVGGSTTMGYVAGTQSLWTIGGSEQMRLTSTGLGIGTSSPAVKLDVNSSAAAVMRLTRNGGTAANTALQYFNGTVSWYAGMSASGLYSIGYNDAALDSGAFRLDSSGNLGLGVTPSAWSAYKAFDINTQGSIASTGTQMSMFQNAYWNGSAFTYKTANAAAQYNQVNGQHQWSIAPSGTAGNAITFTQAMTLDASGNLGIGTSSPPNYAGYKTLAINGTSGGEIDFLDGGTTRGQIYSASTGMTFTTLGAIPLYLGTNGTTKATLDSSGNLGIGTTSPGYKLDIQGAAGVGAQIYETSTGTNKRLRITQESAYVKYEATYSSGGNAHSWWNGGTRQMDLDVSGNLGIGTSSPARKLDVNGTIRITDGQSIEWGGTSLYIAGTSNTLLFGTSGSEKMRLDSSGNLGIGTSSPGAKLGVTSPAATAAAGAWRSGSTDSVYFTLGRNAYEAGVGVTGTTTLLTGASVGDLNIYNSLAGASIRFGTGNAGTIQATLDSSGNLGLGVTPSAWGTAGSAYKVIQYGVSGFLASRTANEIALLGTGAYNDGTNWRYLLSGNYASFYSQASGAHAWYTAPSGTAGNAITFTQAMTLDNSGNLVIGDTSASYRLDVRGSTGNGIAYRDGTVINYLGTTGSNLGYLGTLTNHPVAFLTNATERARIDTSGNLLVGTTTNSETSRARIMNVNSSEWGSPTLLLSDSSGTKTFSIYNGAVGYNAAQTVGQIAKNTTTSRSLNAAGTVNASGADYAEYMTKAGEFTISKGDICGIDATGKLTNLFANAVSFVVKSTDPSYVGGDSWGAGFENDPDGLEIARQQVDRIAFAGQVPVNVIGATSGQYIVPIYDNGLIKGKAVSNPTFEQYQQAVGKVIAVEADGRARIIVKVA